MMPPVDEIRLHFNPASLAVLNVVLAFLAARAITLPFRSLGRAADRIASGDLTARVAPRGRVPARGRVALVAPDRSSALALGRSRSNFTRAAPAWPSRVIASCSMSSAARTKR